LTWQDARGRPPGLPHAMPYFFSETHVMLTKEQFAKMQDHSILGTYCKSSDVRRFCEEVKVTACNLVVESGADYVKQSTGTTPNSSFCLGDTRLLKNVVGDKIGIKSSGCIMNVEDAIGSIEFGASRVGNSLAPQWLDEFDKQLWCRK
jgi:deoxyribose-phosphate aldolase